MLNFSKKYCSLISLTIIQKAILCTLALTNLSGIVRAQVDSIPKKRNQLTIGINLAKEVSSSSIYSPRNHTLLGLSFGFNNIIFKASANYVNRVIFENRNYNIGRRDKRIFPLSGFELDLIYVADLYDNKIIHPMIGIEYKKSVIYGGWRNTIYLNNTQILINRSVSVNRVVNFTDKFYQVCGLAGFYFSSNNRFGYALYFPIGINIQGSNNSHYIKKVRGVGNK